jgi:hypothetical protein
LDKLHCFKPNRPTGILTLQPHNPATQGGSNHPAYRPEHSGKNGLPGASFVSLRGIKGKKEETLSERRMEMKTSPIVTLLIIFFLSSLAYAEEPKKPSTIKELETLESIETGQTIFDKMEELKDSMKKMWTERYYDCLKAFGNKEFCSCLNDNLSAFLTFSDYMMTVTHTKEELDYKSRSKDERTLIDNAIRIRNQCVEKCFR